MKSLATTIDAKLAEQIPIHQVMHDVDAHYVDPVALLSIVLPTLHFPHNELIRVVLSGDGRKSGKNYGVILTLKIMGDGGEEKVYPIAIGRGTENYDNIKLLLGKLHQPLLALKKHVFLIRSQSVKCQLTFASDAKFLLTCLGLCAAMGKYSCPFYCIPNTHWTAVYLGLLNANDFRRTRFNDLSVCLSNCPGHKTCGKAKHGVKNENLLEGLFTFEDILLDELHLFLRLWNLVLDILLGYVEAYNREFLLEKVAKIFGVTFHILDGEDEGGYQLWTPLTGDKALLLLDGLVKRRDLMRLLFLVDEESIHIPEDESMKEKEEGHEIQFQRIYSLFESLSQIIHYLRDDRTTLSCFAKFQECIQKFFLVLTAGWGSVIGKVWYLHQLYCHIPTLLTRWGGSIYFASCSSQERLNGKHTSLLLSCVQKQNSSLQLFTRARRELYFEQNSELKTPHKQVTRKKKTKEEKLIGSKTKLSLNEKKREETDKPKKKKERRTRIALIQ